MTGLDLSDYRPSDDLSRAETMPARWYIEPEFLALEAEKIFYKTWQPVGRVEDVLRIGDYFCCDVLDQPLVITRNRAGELRGFYNVCAHRAAVVAQGAAIARACNANITAGPTIWMASCCARLNSKA